MLNFRYHLVSLTAVFLALAIGVIAGQTGISKPFVNQLRKERDRISVSNAELRERNEGLDRRLAMWESYGEKAFSAQIAGALRGVSVVRVFAGGVPAPVRAGVESALRSAGAGASGTMVLSERWALHDLREREALSRALASSAQDAGDLWREAGGRLAARLTQASDPRLETDLLKLLEDESLASLEDVPRGVFPAPGAVLLIVAGGDTRAGAPTDPFLTSLGRGLTKVKSAFAEPLAAPSPGIEELRAVVEIRDSISTVDHIDTALGRLAMVSALYTEARGLAPVHFGTGKRAGSLGPSVARPPSPSPTASPS